jgi:uncharacterized protein (DUF58 family)
MSRPLFYRGYRWISGFRYRIVRRFSRAGRFAFFLLVLAAALGADTNQTTAYQAFTFLLALVGLSIVWVTCRSFSRNRFSARRRLPRFVTAGSPVNYWATVKNESARPQRSMALLENLEDPRPSWREFSAKSRTKARGLVAQLDELFGYTRWRKLIAKRQPAVIGEQTVPDLPANAEVQLRVEFTARRRGRIHFTGMTMARPDPLGLVRNHDRLSLPQSLLVLPRRYILPRVDLPGTREYQPLGVALASSVGQSDEFVALRDYRPGDSLRQIHWKSVAKIDRLVVRENEDEFFVRHALILDTFAAPEQEDAFEEAVSVAASFVCTLQTQESLLDLLFVGTEAYCFTAGRGVGHVDRMLEILAGVEMCADKSITSLEALVLRHAGLVSGCVCVFVAWDGPRRHIVGLLKSLRVPLRVCVVTETDAPSLDPGPMKDAPHHFHHLRVGKIQETLSGL